MSSCCVASDSYSTAALLPDRNLCVSATENVQTPGILPGCLWRGQDLQSRLQSLDLFLALLDPFFIGHASVNASWFELLQCLQGLVEQIYCSLHVIHFCLQRCQSGF